MYRRTLRIHQARERIYRYYFENQLMEHFRVKHCQCSFGTVFKRDHEILGGLAGK